MNTAVGLPGLLPGMHELIAELVERLRAGEAFDNRALTRTADRIFGGSRAKGAYCPRDAYDAMETAAGRLLLGERAEASLQMPVVEALSSLRSLTVQLPRQDDRTTEQIQRSARCHHRRGPDRDARHGPRPDDCDRVRSRCARERLICPPARKLMEIVKSLTHGEVEIKVNGLHQWLPSHRSSGVRSRAAARRPSE